MFLKTFVHKFSYIRKLINGPSPDPISLWEQQGKPVPPPHAYKQKVISQYQKKYNYRILIETGTFLGDMIAAQLRHFDKIISIELGEELHKRAVERFKKYPNVEIIQGDSGIVLHNVMKRIDEPCIFWLDGHYSAGVTAKGEKECPIIEELDAIFKYPQHEHILLIDDARLFTGSGDYPTIEMLSDYINKKSNKKYNFSVKNDIIRYELY